MATRFPFWPVTGAAASDPAIESEVAASWQALLVPAVLVVLMLIVGSTAGMLADVSGQHLLPIYLKRAASITVICVLVYVFARIVKLARQRAPDPLQTVSRCLRARAPLLLMPLVLLPLFATGFTTAKASLAHLVGFPWEAFWADTDVLIFGDDAWRITHKVISPSLMGVMGLFYTTIWLLMLPLFKANVAIYASPRRAAQIYTSLLATWFVVGWFLAYCFSAAGPIYAHLVDPALAERFAPLRETLYGGPGQGGGIRIVQEYLWNGVQAHQAVTGGGVSAMPSVHVAINTIYVLAARGTRWMGPAVAYWIIIFIGSAYFGYHYWVDAIVAMIATWGCWRVTEAFYREQPEKPSEFAVGAG